MTEEARSSEEFAKTVEENLFFVFKVKYNGSEENKDTHRAFQEFCMKHTDNSYILGIRKLLEIAETDWKYETLYGEILAIKEKLAEMKGETKPEAATFGKQED